MQQAKANRLEDGTTACTVFISGTDLFCVNVGDSEALLVQVSGGSAKGLKIAKTHKPADVSERERIHQLGGQVCDQSFFADNYAMPWPPFVKVFL